MRILALDLARQTGVTVGNAGEPRPKIYLWELYRQGQTYFSGVQRLGCFLRDILSVDQIDLIVVEDFLNPVAQKSYDAAIAALLFQGAVHSIAACYEVPVRRVKAAEARVHFCGRSRANPARRRGDPPKSSRQIAQDRLDTKRMIWRRAVTLGYFDRGQRENYDLSDSVCVWDYAVAKFSGVTRPLVLTGE